MSIKTQNASGTHIHITPIFTDYNDTEIDSLKARKWVSKEKEPKSPNHPSSVITTE